MSIYARNRLERLRQSLSESEHVLIKQALVCLDESDKVLRSGQHKNYVLKKVLDCANKAADWASDAKKNDWVVAEEISRAMMSAANALKGDEEASALGSAWSFYWKAANKAVMDKKKTCTEDALAAWRREMRYGKD